MKLRELFLRPDPHSEQVWHCDPLVIVDEDGVVAFGGKVDVEFKPETGPDHIGTAVMVGVTREGWNPRLIVKSRFERMDRIPDIRFGMRAGFTLLGEDEDGIGFGWHIDGAADLFLTIKADEDASHHQPVEMLVVVNESSETIFSGPATLLMSPSVNPDRTHRLEVAGTELFLETIDEQAVEGLHESEPTGMIYQGTGPDDKCFTWHVEVNN